MISALAKVLFVYALITLAAYVAVDRRASDDFRMKLMLACVWPIWVPIGVMDSAFTAAFAPLNQLRR